MYSSLQANLSNMKTLVVLLQICFPRSEHDIRSAQWPSNNTILVLVSILELKQLFPL